jgi:hypothetical protein
MTDTRTYQADAADEWLPLRIAGSLDNGAIDVEYSPVHKIAADERHDDHEQRLHQLESEMRAANESIAQAWKYVELLLHRPANETPDSDGLTAAYMLGAYDGKHGTGTGTDYAHIPLAEWQEIMEELEQLRSGKSYTDGVIAGARAVHDNYAANGVAVGDSALIDNAAIGASVPWKDMLAVHGPNEQISTAEMFRAESRIQTWLDAHAPKGATE